MRYVILVLCLLFSSHCLAEEKVRFMEVFGATWCPPCQKLKSDLKNDQNLKIFVEKRFKKVNNIDVSNVPLSKYGLSKIPTVRTWVWDKESGKWVLEKTIVGYNDPKSFISSLEDNKYGKLGNYRSSNAKRTN